MFFLSLISRHKYHNIDNTTIAAMLAPFVVHRIFVITTTRVYIEYKSNPNYLVKTLLLQSFAKDLSNACQSVHRLLAHGLGHKVFMFLGCRRHGCFVDGQRSPTNEL